MKAGQSQNYTVIFGEHSERFTLRLLLGRTPPTEPPSVLHGTDLVVGEFIQKQQRHSGSEGYEFRACNIVNISIFHFFTQLVKCDASFLRLNVFGNLEDHNV